MRWRKITAIVLLGITLAASVAARQGIYEYWKAGTKTRHSRSTLPTGRARTHTRQPGEAARTTPTVTIVPWSEAWFADSTRVRRRLAEMTKALTVPMIGESYPLPRGGGFVCSRTEGNGAEGESGLRCVLQCAGPELGGLRRNWFYASDPNPAPTLDRVRWLIVAPGSSARAPWRAFVLALEDSLDRSLGRPNWAGPDRMEATWSGMEYTTTLRLCGNSERIDSLEIECVSGRLAGPDRRERAQGGTN